MHPLTKYPLRTAILAPQCFGSVAWYRALAAHGKAVIDSGLTYDKRFKSIHRYSIADVRGPLTLTVPAGHPLPGGPRLWSRVMISDHGEWPHVHLTTLESAYGRTPYFEFYIDRIAPLLSFREVSVTDFCLQADAVIRDILGIPTEILAPEATNLADGSPEAVGRRSPETVFEVGGSSETVDLRSPAALAAFEPLPYRQHRQDTLGFIPGLSVLDLIFNLGPEAPFVLL